jgi:hypothetical protein
VVVVYREVGDGGGGLSIANAAEMELAMDGAGFLRRERAGRLGGGTQGRLYPQVKADINGFPKSAEVFNGLTMATAYGGEG